MSGFKGRFYVDDSLFLLFVILTKVLVRISIHAAKNANTCKCNVASCKGKQKAGVGKSKNRSDAASGRK